MAVDTVFDELYGGNASGAGTEGAEVVLRVDQSTDSNLLEGYLGTRSAHIFAAGQRLAGAGEAPDDVTPQEAGRRDAPGEPG